MPAKMTSSILPPRSVRGPWAPSTHATASTRFDLPEPFGPTTTVTPGSKSSTVLSAKDLKPFSVSDLRNTRGWLLSLVPDRSDAPRRRRGQGVRAGQAPRGPLGHVGISEPRSRVPRRAARRARPTVTTRARGGPCAAPLDHRVDRRPEHPRTRPRHGRRGGCAPSRARPGLVPRVRNRRGTTPPGPDPTPSPADG